MSAPPSLEVSVSSPNDERTARGLRRSRSHAQGAGRPHSRARAAPVTWPLYRSSTGLEAPIRANAPHLVAVAVAAPVTAAALDADDAADRDAVERTLDGDATAFGAVVHRHGRGLVSLCARVCGDGRIGEELAQEALARAYTRLGSWRADGRFRSWLYRIALNLCRDHLKAGARAERPEEAAGEEIAGPSDPERALSDRELATALRVELARLPPAQQEAFVLFHAEGLSYEEMRAITGVSVGALKVRVHRARTALREALGPLVGAPRGAPRSPGRSTS